jgi:hypothetical protein
MNQSFETSHHLAELLEAAGVHEVEESALSVDVEHPSFEDWWEPFLLGVDPAGGYVARLDPGGRVDCATSAGRCCRQRRSSSRRVHWRHEALSTESRLSFRRPLSRSL